MDLGDDRLVHVEYLHAQALPLLQAPDVVVDLLAAAIVRPLAGAVFGQIGAGAEMRTGAAQHHAMHPVMLVGLQQGRVQFAVDFRAEGVALFRSVQRDDRGGPGHLVGDLFEFHCFPLRIIREAYHNDPGSLC